MPVATDARPVPSRSTSTSTLVSFVLRFTALLRMQYPLFAAFFRGLFDLPHFLRIVFKGRSPYLGCPDPGSLNLSHSLNFPSCLGPPFLLSARAAAWLSAATGRSRLDRLSSNPTPRRCVALAKAR